MGAEVYENNLLDGVKYERGIKDEVNLGAIDLGTPKSYFLVTTTYNPKRAMRSVKTALKEYRKNYKANKPKALIAHDNMNMFIDDDCGGAAMGDLLLKDIREEMKQEDYDKEPTEHADMTTILMQGNIDAVNSLMSSLALAADTEDDSWLARLKDGGDLEKLIGRYDAKYKGLSESKINSLIKSDFDEDAKVLAEKMGDLKDTLKVYTECEVKADTDYAKVEAYFNEHADESKVAWSKAGALYLILSDIKMGGQTFADIVTGNGYDFTDPDDRMELYPVINAMSSGQRALLKYVDLGEMILTGSLDEAGWKEYSEKNAEDHKPQPKANPQRQRLPKVR